MQSRTKLLGHAVHPAMVMVPLGLFVTSTVFDAIALVTRDKQFAGASHKMIGVGVVSGAAAGVFGLLDWLAIPNGTRAKEIGAVHGIGNGVVSAVFAASWLMRRDAPESPEAPAIILSLLGTALAGVTGWLGGELVERLGVGVDEGANLNAPNSLTGEPAGEKWGEELPGYHPEGIFSTMHQTMR